MPASDTLERALPIALSVLDDDRVTSRLSRARTRARKAGRARGRGPSRRSPLAFGLLAAQDLAGATVAARSRAQREQRRRRRANRLRLGVVGLVAGAAATVFALNRPAATPGEPS